MQRESQQLVKDLNNLGMATRGVGRGLATIGAAPAGIVLLDLAKAATTASQSILMLPAAATAAAAGIGTLKLATAGFADTIKDVRDVDKFAEGLQKLSPNAQQAALSIRKLLPEFDKLQQATQNSGFKDFGKNFERLSSTYLPSIQGMTTRIADSFNQMASGISNQLMQPGTQTQLKSTMDNIAAAFQNAAPAAKSFTQAFVNITEVGSGFLPGLAQDVSTLASNFASFISEARQSGQLEEWISQGIEAVKLLGQAIFGVGKFIFQVFGSDGRKNVEDFRDTLQSLREIAGVLTGDFSILGASVQEEFEAMTGASAVFRDSLLDIPEVVVVIENKIREALNSVNHAINWMANNATNAINQLNPFGDDKPYQPIPDLPMVGSGDWGQYQGTPDVTGRKPGQYRTRFGDQRPLPGATVPGGPWSPQAVPGPPLEKGGAGGAAAKDPGIGGAFTAGFTDTRSGWNPAMQDLMETQKKLSESTQELNRNLADSIAPMQELGVALDKDFGLSKGLPGLAENLVRFLGNLAAAPILGPLAAISAAQGGIDKTGSGLIGMIASQAGIGGGGGGGGLASILGGTGGGGGGTAGGGGLASILGGTGGGGGGAAAIPGESARSFAHRAMMPFWESLGFKVGDHAADQFGEHQNGALDIMVGSLEEGQTVLQKVLSDPNTYGAIFNNQVFGYGRGAAPRDYSAGHTGNPTQDHQDHVHALYKPGGRNNIIPPGTAAGGMPAGTATPPGGGGLNWDALAAKEGSPPGNWQTNTGNGYYGGLQFDQATWAQYGGTKYAPNAAMATKEQQIAIAQAAYGARGGGSSLWPANYGQLNQPKTFDQGGWLQPGTTVVQNNTGRPEAVFPPSPGPFGPRANTDRTGTRQPGGPAIGAGGPLTPGAPGGAPGVGGAAGGLPGAAGAISRGSTAVGGGEPKHVQGGAPTGGGIAGAAASAGAMAADMFAPGSGAAVQLAFQEIQRAIKFGSQAAGIGVQGLMETFLPMGASDLAQNNWITRVAGGFADVAPQIPNLAGKSATTDAMAGQGTPTPMALPPPISSGQGAGPPPGPPVVVNYTHNGAKEDPAINQLTSQLRTMHASQPIFQR